MYWPIHVLTPDQHKQVNLHQWELIAGSLAKQYSIDALILIL